MNLSLPAMLLEVLLGNLNKIIYGTKSTNGTIK